MRKLIDLFNFEFNRFLKFFLPMLGLIFFGQLAVIIRKTLMYKAEVDEVMLHHNFQVEEAMAEIGDPFSMYIATHSATMYLLVRSIFALLIFYAFYVWYRDWQGKNTFAYRLLMLPINRLSIYLSKLLIFPFAGFAYIAFQYFSHYIYQWIVKMMIAPEFFKAMTAFEVFKGSYVYQDMIPTNFLGMLFFVGFFLVLLTILFTAIILHLSYRLKGLILGGIWIALLVGSYLLSIIIPNSFFPSEWFMFRLNLFVIWFILSVGISIYLIKSKITC